MELWYPPNDRPHLLEWWRPLMLASAAARAEEVPWPIWVDQFVLRGRVDRRSRPAIWVYRHGPSGGELYLDATGQPYRFRRTPNARVLGRFEPCTIRIAVHQAGLPATADPFGGPGPHHGRPEGDDDPTSEVATRRYGHLTVVDGGRAEAG